MKLFDRDRVGANPDGTFKDHVAGVTAGTQITANIFNQIGAETDAVIKSGGLTPNSNDVTQLDTSIKTQIKNAVKVVNDKAEEINTNLTSNISSVNESLEAKINNLNAESIKYVNTTSKLKSSNIQDAIDELQNNRNIIVDGQEYNAGFYYNGKPVYYRAWSNIDANNLNDGNTWNVDQPVEINANYTSIVRSDTYYYHTFASFNGKYKRFYARYNYGSTAKSNSTFLIFYYTKTTDSRLL